MLKIIKNTYPKNRIGKHNIGTFCKWRIERGHLILSVCDEKGNFKRYGFNYVNIFSHGQIYALNGNLLSGRKEPPKIGDYCEICKKWLVSRSFRLHITNTAWFSF